MWVALCVFSATLETDFLTFTVGVYPTGWLASAADWCNWSGDEKGFFLPWKTFCWWIQATATVPLGNGINEQLSAHFKGHACCYIWNTTKQPHFVKPNTVEAIRSSSVSVGWWIVKELPLIQGPLYNSLLELLLACQSPCVHIHVAMSSSFIQVVRGFSDPLLKLCYLAEAAMDVTVFIASSVKQTGREVGFLLSPRKKDIGPKAEVMWSPDPSPHCGILLRKVKQERKPNGQGSLKWTRLHFFCFVNTFKVLLAVLKPHTRRQDKTAAVIPRPLGYIPLYSQILHVLCVLIVLEWWIVQWGSLL